MSVEEISGEFRGKKEKKIESTAITAIA